MEIYNDAMLKASANVSSGDEIFVRGSATVANPVAVSKLLLPAVRRKLEILESMKSEHAAFTVPSDAKQAGMCLTLWTAFVSAAIDRGRLQEHCFEEWLVDPTLDVSARSMSLDRAESVAMNAAIDRLNWFIQKAGYAGDPWLDLNCEAFNRVRGRIGLAPLSREQFGSLFLLNMTGQKTRFFD